MTSSTRFNEGTIQKIIEPRRAEQEYHHLRFVKGFLLPTQSNIDVDDSTESGSSSTRTSEIESSSASLRYGFDRAVSGTMMMLHPERIAQALEPPMNSLYCMEEANQYQPTYIGDALSDGVQNTSNDINTLSEMVRSEQGDFEAKPKKVDYDSRENLTMKKMTTESNVVIENHQLCRVRTTLVEKIAMFAKPVSGTDLHVTRTRFAMTCNCQRPDCPYETNEATELISREFEITKPIEVDINEVLPATSIDKDVEQEIQIGCGTCNIEENRSKESNEVTSESSSENDMENSSGTCQSSSNPTIATNKDSSQLVASGESSKTCLTNLKSNSTSSDQICKLSEKSMTFEEELKSSIGLMKHLLASSPSVSIPTHTPSSSNSYSATTSDSDSFSECIGSKSASKQSESEEIDKNEFYEMVLKNSATTQKKLVVPISDAMKQQLENIKVSSLSIENDYLPLLNDNRPNLTETASKPTQNQIQLTTINEEASALTQPTKTYNVSKSRSNEQGRKSSSLDLVLPRLTASTKCRQFLRKKQNFDDSNQNIAHRIGIPIAYISSSEDSMESATPIPSDSSSRSIRQQNSSVNARVNASENFVRQKNQRNVQDSTLSATEEVHQSPASTLYDCEDIKLQSNKIKSPNMKHGRGDGYKGSQVY